jgi:hypothetical protein
MLVLAIVGGAAECQKVHYEGALSVATGKYIFTERTTSWTLLNGLAFSAGPLTLRGSVPVYAQNTSLISGTSAGLLPTGGSSSGVVADSSAARKGGGQGGGGRNPSTVVTLPQFSEVSAQGVSQVEVPTTSVTGYETILGDPTVNLSLDLKPGMRTALTLGAGAKVPVTDTTGYGTGEWDYGASVSLSQMLGFSALMGVDLAYWHFGDFAELDLRDGVMGSASVAYLGRRGWGGTASVSGARSVIEGFADSYSLGLGLTRVGRRGTVSLNVSVGLSETTPDATASLSWRVAVL